MSRPDHSTYREWLNLDADGVRDAPPLFGVPYAIYLKSLEGAD